MFQHDRAGRLVDAQEFEHLAFDRRRFYPALLEELVDDGAERRRCCAATASTSATCTPSGGSRRSTSTCARRSRRRREHAVLDYGQCLRDLAGTNIFPGDLLLKNFGVTRQQRVVFYDYDELWRC